MFLFSGVGKFFKTINYHFGWSYYVNYISTKIQKSTTIFGIKSIPTESSAHMDVTLQMLNHLIFKFSVIQISLLILQAMSMNHNVNIYTFWHLRWPLVNPQIGHDPQSKNHCSTTNSFCDISVWELGISTQRQIRKIIYLNLHIHGDHSKSYIL